MSSCGSMSRASTAPNSAEKVAAEGDAAEMAAAGGGEARTKGQRKEKNRQEQGAVEATRTEPLNRKSAKAVRAAARENSDEEERLEGRGEADSKVQGEKRKKTGKKKQETTPKRNRNLNHTLNGLLQGATRAKLRLPPIFDHYLAAHPFKILN